MEIEPREQKGPHCALPPLLFIAAFPGASHHIWLLPQPWLLPTDGDRPGPWTTAAWDYLPLPSREGLPRMVSHRCCYSCLVPSHPLPLAGPGSTRDWGELSHPAQPLLGVLLVPRRDSKCLSWGLLHGQATSCPS